MAPHTSSPQKNIAATQVAVKADVASRNGITMPAVPVLFSTSAVQLKNEDEKALLQKKAGEEEERLQMKSQFQLKAVEEEVPLQKKPFQLKNNAVHKSMEWEEVPLQKKTFQLAKTNTTAQTNTRPNQTGMPDNLKAGVEALSGIAMDDVKVHYNSNKPAQLQALAYAQGTDIHIAPGQEKHLPHEAWHVVQQKQGRVKPTMQMKGGVAVNDDKGLESEADVMGAKVLAATVNAPLQSGAPGQFKKVQSTVVTQLVRINKVVTGVTHLVKLVGSSLYNSNFEENEMDELKTGDLIALDTEVRFRSRRGPNQEKYQETDKSGPRHYLWYKVISFKGEKAGDDLFIREDTFTDVDQKKLLNLPLDANVYGTDAGSTKEIKDAYAEGQRDFDCAYSYHNGETYKLFKSFKINKGPVRIIYKFKLGEFEKASEELSKFIRIQNVIIHTIMLHEVPETPDETALALKKLAFLAKMYHCLAGVSNVNQTGIDDNADLDKLKDKLQKKGVNLSMVENRMNPAVPDKAVREYCRQQGIKYLAYGLTGPQGVGGTCGLVPGGSGDYRYLEDEEIAKISGELEITKEQFRSVVYTWARAQHVSVITRSSDSGRREANKKNYPFSNPNLENKVSETLNSFSQWSHAETYIPLEKHLLEHGIAQNIIDELPGIFGKERLELYYKRVIVEGLDPGELVKLLASFEKLDRARGDVPKTGDITGMREWINKANMDIAKPPAQATTEQLIAFAKDNNFKILNAAYTPLDITNGSGGLEGLSEIHIQSVVDLGIHYGYTKDEKGVFQLED